MTAPRALHPTSGLRPGAWYACDHPERTPNRDTAFDPQCPGCNLALEAYSKITGTNPPMEYRSRGGVEETRKATASSHLSKAKVRRDR